MSLVPWEIETSDDGTAWRTLGFVTTGGFNPYRWNEKADAEREMRRLVPAGFRRVVRARSMMEEKIH
jgi:hypothetical protein